MKKSAIDNEERQSRLPLLKNYKQRRNVTVSSSRIDFAKERGIELRYLLNCPKWHDQVCKRQTKKTGVVHISKSDGFPVLVASINFLKATNASSIVLFSSFPKRTAAICLYSSWIPLF